MFLKKLFGKSSAPAIPEQQWRNPDWIKYSYPTRYGTESCVIEVDPSYCEGNPPAALQHNVRVLLPLHPSKQDSQTQPLNSAKADLQAAEASLLKALTAKGVQGMLVATLNYEGWQEWVLMLSNKDGLGDAIAHWTHLMPSPGLQVWESEGWSYYNDCLSPSDIDRIHLNGERLIVELNKQGTNREVPHWLKHSFTGAHKDLLSLRLALIQQGFTVEDGQQAQLIAYKSCHLTITATQQLANQVHDMAKAADVRYHGWSAELVKERWLNGQVKDGTGEFMHANGALYKGDFKNGIKHGKGWIRFNDGTTYDGDWLEGKRTGKAALYWSHQEYYLGEFLNGELHGQGRYQYANGNRFDGNWLNGAREGQGSFHWANGDHYFGEWKADKRSGYGRVVYAAPPEWYEGQLEQGELHGQGYDFNERKNCIRHAIWQSSTGVQSEIPIPESPPGLLRWEARNPGIQAEIEIREHAAKAKSEGRIPCVYWRSGHAPASHYFKHYHVLPVFSDIFQGISVLEIPFEAANLIMLLDCPVDAILIRIDPATNKATKWIQAPVWHTHTFAHARNQLQYILE
jgi:hypothetical protein